MNSATQSAFSIPQFCETHDISRALFYLLQKDGRAPRTMQVGRRVLISIEAATEWRRRMETGSADISASV